MTFGQPVWFWAFALLPVLLALFLHHERRREKLLRQLIAVRLRERLAGSLSVARRRWRFALLLLALGTLIVALAQPRYGHTWEESRRKGRDVILAIDCSRSMLATDLAPSRLGRAKLAAQDLIGQLGGDRVGLIAFAGSAFLQAPLTVDYGAVLNSLAELDAGIIPRGGTNIAAAIKEAETAFGKGESEHRCLIIFTDGEELDADGIAAAAAQEGRIKMFTVGLGSSDGSLIPVPGENGGTAFVKDESGQIVKSRLDEDRLRKIAEATGGFYLHLQNGPAEMQQIVRTGLGQMKEQDIDARLSRRPIERYQWPLSAALALLVGTVLLRERKRVLREKAARLGTIAGVACGLMASAADAKNSGVAAYEREDYQGATREFRRQLERQRNSEALHFNLGAAAYKSGDFGKALEAFARAVTSPDSRLRGAAEYNLGNTLFQRGQAAPEKERKVREWKDALQHYDQALKLEPQNENAVYNREVVRKLLEELEKESPPQDKNDEQKNNDPKDQQPPSGQGKPDEKPQPQKDEQSPPGSEPQDKPQPGSPSPKDQPSLQNGAKDDPGEKKPGDNKTPGEMPDPSSQQGQEQKEKPASTAEQTEQKRSGDIQSAQNGATSPSDPQQEAAAEAQAAAEGKMTEKQAMHLLESLKGEDERVPLRSANERRPVRAFRDW